VWQQERRFWPPSRQGGLAARPQPAWRYQGCSAASSSSRTSSPLLFSSSAPLSSSWPCPPHSTLTPPRSMEPATPAEKRKRSPSSAAPPSAPPAKASKTSNQLSINYLSRHSRDDLPLLHKDDTLPNLLQLLTAYSNVLDRHESLASNLGARPLAPILIKRFERCFDAPPKVVASHHKGSSTNPEDSNHSISWLEVIEFARAHPSQFTLSTFSEGKRVCQFYYPQKQLRVQVNEDDFLFINSGRCQELIPPLPIWEDEEKEVGTCDVLEAKLKELTNAADMVAARTRQLSHRLKGRRAAILERRAEGGFGTPAKANPSQTTTAPPSSTACGFVAVNNTGDKPNGELEISTGTTTGTGTLAAVRSELLKHFESLPHNQSQGRSHSRHHSLAGHADPSHHAMRQLDTAFPEHADSVDRERAASTTSSLSPIPPSFQNDISYYTAEGHRPTAPHVHRPSSSVGGRNYGSSHAPVKHNFSRPLPQALESAQPFRPLCQAHMDSLPRGHRVLPPCDRCRRLRMDCVKNLTSCAGCTKKHARCHWRDVSRDELGDLDHLMDSEYPVAATSHEDQANGYANGLGEVGDLDAEDSDEDDSNPLEDLEALGEKEDQREKELAERMREDEEGLRNAKELSRQGRENSLNAAQLIHEDATSNGPELPPETNDETEPHDSVALDDTPKASQDDSDANSAVAAEQDQDNKGDRTSEDTGLPTPQSTLPVPNPISSNPMGGLPFSTPAMGGGFRAVNGPVNGSSY
jgi:hypothetical protein